MTITAHPAWWMTVRSFKFPLQTALDLRRREEEAAQCRLGEARRAAEGIRAELQQSRASRDEIITALRTGSSDGSLTLPQIEHAHRYISGLRDAIDRLKERLTEAERVCDQRRAELMAASRARGTLERLRERRQEQHRQEELALEQRQLDEIAVSRHRRRTEMPQYIDETGISARPDDSDGVSDDIRGRRAG